MGVWALKDIIANSNILKLKVT